MANARVSKADRLLARLAGNTACALTPEGARFIRQRFDPYHDLPTKPVGYCDDYNGVTVSRCIKRTITISQTSGGATPTENPWDCHIFLTPMLESKTYRNTLAQNGNQFGWDFAAAVSPEYGGLMIVGNNVSGSDFTYPFNSEPTQTVLGRLKLNSNDLSNNMRVTSVGFEVIDGTAELYKQGILTCYRQNQPVQNHITVRGNCTTNRPAATMLEHVSSAWIIKTPPINSGTALLIPGSKQWEVKEGAYVSADFNTDELEMGPPKPVSICLIGDSDRTDVGNASDVFRQISVTNNYNDEIIPGTSPATTIRWMSPEATRVMPIQQSGVFLTGLNPLATITVNMIMYVECAPEGDDEELLTLAYQSPKKDSCAMMIISELRYDSPVCVKRRENYMGQWFVDGVKSVIDTVMPWMHNATIVGNQVSKWINEAGQHDGMLQNPQTFVKGDVAKQVARENNIRKGPPPAPGPAPRRVAFKPSPFDSVVGAQRKNDGSQYKTRRRRKLKGVSEAEIQAQREYIAKRAAGGHYKMQQRGLAGKQNAPVLQRKRRR